MSDLPFDLRTLGEVDEPEVVARAIRRARRKLLSTGAVVMAAALAVLATAGKAYFDKSPRERIEQAFGVFPGTVHEVGPATVIVAKVAPLDAGTVGLHLVAAVPGAAEGDVFFLHPSAGLLESDVSPESRLTETWLEVTAPPSGQVEIIVERQPPCTPQDDGECLYGDALPVGGFTIDVDK